MDTARRGDYESSSAGPALASFMIGLGLGALLALLYAPQSGRQTRRLLRDKLEDARERMEDWSEQAGEIIEKGQAWANTAKEKIGPMARAVIRKS